jgi:HEAT repeat protein
MSLAEYIDELRDPDHQVTSTSLAQLSGLLGEELEELRARWAELPVERRQEIMNRLAELAEDDVETDFYAVFFIAMSDAEAAVRERAVLSLWETDDRTAIPKLAHLLDSDPADEVRAAAAIALGHFSALADARKLVSRDVDRVFQALKSALEDDDEPVAVRRRTLESIAPFRLPEVHTWIQWGYDQAEPLLRQSSVYAMGRNGDPRWLPAVYDEFDSEDPAMRYEAVGAARELGETESLPYLAEMVEDLDTQVSLAALQAIATIGGAQARQMLQGFAASGEDQVQREAAQEALEALITEADDFAMLRVDPESDSIGGAVRDPDDFDDDEDDAYE